jgi:peptidoglycan DL-endopeptidase CwlO
VVAFPYSRLAHSCRLGGITALTVGATLLFPASGADAVTETSTTAVKKELEKLNNKVDKLANQYDKATTQLAAAKKLHAALNNEMTTEKSQYQNLRDRVVRMAVAAYKNGTLDSATFVASKNPSAALEEMSTFVELSRSRSQELTALLASAQRLRREQEESRTTLQTIATTTAALKRQKATVEKAIARQKTLLAKINSSNESTSDTSGSSGISVTVSGSSAARIAMNYAIAQLGKPYIFGGTGPTGFDCSGLTMMAWRSAGVDLPRVVPDQYHAIRHVAKSDLQPGDLVFFDDLGHEGIYVGGGRFIHAPHTGTDVQYASMSNPYWVANYVGAGRP